MESTDSEDGATPRMIWEGIVKKLFQSRLFAACAASTLTAVVVSGIAWAAIPSSTTGNIAACYRTTGPNKGAVRIIDHQAGRACYADEAMLTWPAAG